MRIGLATTDRGGCRWYRLALPYGALARHAGHEVVWGDAVAATRDGEITLVQETKLGPVQHSNLDVVVLQRCMDALAAGATRRAVALGQVVVNDVDDWFFGIPPSNTAFATTHPNWCATCRQVAPARRGHEGHRFPNDQRNANHYRAALAESSLITTSTPYLAERLCGLAPVEVLPNAIDLARWTVGERRDGPPVVGWYGHLGFRASGDVPQLRGLLGPWLDRHPDVRVLHVGATDKGEAFAEAAGVDPSRVAAEPPCGLDELPGRLAAFDVGLAPLEDCPFNRSKSWIKSLEYAAAGIPHVASALPEYRELGAAVVAKRPPDWTRALDRLLDPGERAKVGDVARAVAERHDIERMWPRWESALYRAPAAARA